MGQIAARGQGTALPNSFPGLMSPGGRLSEKTAASEGGKAAYMAKAGSGIAVKILSCQEVICEYRCTVAERR